MLCNVILFVRVVRPIQRDGHTEHVVVHHSSLISIYTGNHNLCNKQQSPTVFCASTCSHSLRRFGRSLSPRHRMKTPSQSLFSFPLMLDKRSSGTFPIWKIGGNEINVAILLHDMANSPKTLSLSDDSPIIYLFPLANFSTARTATSSRMKRLPTISRCHRFVITYKELWSPRLVAYDINW